MPYLPPPQKGDKITPEFLQSVTQAAYRSMAGAGVHQTHLGGSVAVPLPIPHGEVMLVKLASDLAAGDSADAYLCYWTGSGYEPDTSTIVTVYDVIGTITGSTDDWFFVWQGPDSDNLQVVSPAGGGVKAFLAKESGGPGDTAAAWSLQWNASTGDYDDPTFTDDTDLTVVDTQNCHRWVGWDESPGDDVCSMGYCDANGGIVSVHQQARMCLCQAKIASGNTLATVDNVTPMDGGISPVASSSAELSVTSGFETDDNAVGVIVWDESNDNWRPLDFPCKT